MADQPGCVALSMGDRHMMVDVGTGVEAIGPGRGGVHALDLVPRHWLFAISSSESIESNG